MNTNIRNSRIKFWCTWCFIGFFIAIIFEGCQPAPEPMVTLEVSPIPPTSTPSPAPMPSPTAAPSVTPAEQPTVAPTSATFFRTSAPAYVKDLTGGDYTLLPLLTVGDEIPWLDGTFGAYTPSKTLTYAMPGIPDGMGVYEISDGYYVFLNHEIDNDESSQISSTISGKINGARVSLLQFTRDWRLVGGRNLIDKVFFRDTLYELDLDTGDYLSLSGDRLNRGNGTNLARFCSGSLAVAGFVDHSGNPAPIWFAAEEDGVSSLGWAVYPDGTAVALEALGQFSKEQVYPLFKFRGAEAGTTILLSTEDNSDGELYMYEGQASPDNPNGFAGGWLYALRVEGDEGNWFPYETIPPGVRLVGRWVPVPTETALGSGRQLSSWVNEERHSTNFRRLEDLHEDPSNPGTFYLAATGHEDLPPDGDKPDNAYGKLYRLTLDPEYPHDDLVVELLLEGGPDTGVSYDNLVVDYTGHVLIQEDGTAGGDEIIATQKRYGRVLSYDIASGEVQFLFEAAQPDIDPSSASRYGNWETSGITLAPLGNNDIFGYLFTVQAHTIHSSDYVQGGQLVLACPGSCSFNP